jgi:hypothetical protein
MVSFKRRCLSEERLTTASPLAFVRADEAAGDAAGSASSGNGGGGGGGADSERVLGDILERIYEDVGSRHEPRLVALARGGDGGGELEGGAGDGGGAGGTQPQQPDQEQEAAARREALLLFADDMKRRWRDLHATLPGALASDEHNSGGGDEADGGDAATVAGAAAFELLSLAAEALEAAGAHDEAVLRDLAQICAATCPGSDLALFQALRRASVAQRRWAAGGRAVGADGGPGGGQAEGAADSGEEVGALRRALGARYGEAVVRDGALMERMSAAASEAAAMVAF